MKKSVVTFSLAALILFSFSGCTGLSGTGFNNGTSSSEASAKEYAINDTIQFDNHELTVTKVEKSDGDETSKPQDGMEFVTVTVKIKNNNETEYYYNPLQFRMFNSKGETKDVKLSNNAAADELKPGNLETGAEIESKITFEEPKDDGGLVLYYTDSFFNKDPKFKIKCS